MYKYVYVYMCLYIYVCLYVCICVYVYVSVYREMWISLWPSRVPYFTGDAEEDTSVRLNEARVAGLNSFELGAISGSVRLTPWAL